MYLLGSVFLLLFIQMECNEHRVKRIVGGGPANIPPKDDPVVYTRFNGKTAAVRGVLDFPHYVFRGIRYAKAPVRNLRFVRPQETFLEGFVNATQFPSPCVQPIPGTNKIVGEEDCLFLNIFTPNLPMGMEGLPVVVWIHGGGFRYGSASQYGVRQLVGRNLVVVTIQYRLGSLGFLSGGGKEFPGNAALWDMALAIQWVRNYIGFFGGNPFKIVVMGQGTGASSALTVALTNIAKGKAAGVVAMSGTAVSHWALDNAPLNTARSLAEHNGCPVNSVLTMVKCLQNLDSKEIISGDSNIEFERFQKVGFQNGMAGGLGAAPVNEGRYDGRSLPSLVQNKPMDDLEKDNIPKIPLLLGTTKDETKRSCTKVFNNEIFKALTTIPDFLEKELIKSLQGLIKLPSIPLFPSANNTFGLTGILQAFDPKLFSKYVEVPANDFQAAFSKVAEATGDALFNVPAFLTANMWSKGGETYLYKFEHAGKKKKGNFFLNGYPLVGLYGQENNTAEETNDVSHGDDLAYLFEANNLDGTPSEQDDMNEEDEKVRGHFSQMIADFARKGRISINDKPVKPFSADANNYIQVTSEPKVQDNFRFCEMGLWLGLAQRLQSSVCGFLNVIDTGLQTVQKSFFDTLDKTGLNQLTDGVVPSKNGNKNPLNVLGGGGKNPLNPLNVLGGGNNQKQNVQQQNSNNNPLGLGLLGGGSANQNNNHNIYPGSQQSGGDFLGLGKKPKPNKKKSDEKMNESIEKMSRPLNIFQGPKLGGGLLGK